MNRALDIGPALSRTQPDSGLARGPFKVGPESRPTLTSPASILDPIQG